MSKYTTEQILKLIKSLKEQHAPHSETCAVSLSDLDAIDALLRERESPKAVVTDEIVTVARDAYIRIRSLNWEVENDTSAWRAALEAVAQMLASARVLDGWREAYAAFKGAFDTPAAWLRDDSDFARDARKRLREFNDAMLAAAPKPETEE